MKDFIDVFYGGGRGDGDCLEGKKSVEQIGREGDELIAQARNDGEVTRKLTTESYETRRMLSSAIEDVQSRSPEMWV